MRAFKPLVGIALGAAVLVGILYFFYRAWSAGTPILGFEPASTPPDAQSTGAACRTLLAAAAMLVGILFGSAHHALVQTGTANEPFSWGRLFSPRDLVGALVVSPIVFGGVYTLTKQQPDQVLSALLAFENGFFCQALFQRRQEATKPS